jgi:hypothetical protein
LREIHLQLDDIDQHNLFALMSCQPTSFKEAAKEPHWVQAMNQEIDSIEKNNTWDLVDLAEIRQILVSSGFTKLNSMKRGRLKNTKQDLLPKDSHSNPTLIMVKLLLQ